MRFSFVPIVAALLPTLASAAFAGDACSLLSRNDAAAILGQPVAQVTPAGPQRDEDSGGQLSYCTYRAAASSVVVSVVEFASGAEARKQLTKNLVKERMDEDDAKVSEEAGLGEKSFYGVSAKGAMYVFLKKNKVVGVGAGGAKLNKAAASKESLRGAASSVASKI